MKINTEETIQLIYQTKPLIMNHVNAQKITVKGPADFVTAIDIAVQDFLKKELFDRYPEIQFMGEEDHMASIDPEQPAWILDPIDGTTNLIYDFHHSAVSLGYYEDHQIQFGVIYNPFTEELFYAALGQGAYLNGEKLAVSDKKELKDSLIAVGTSPYEKHRAQENFQLFQKLFENSLDIRRVGAASLDLAYIACGRLDAYVERNLKPWDYAAGTIILTEAGGKISDYQGNALNYCINQDIAATNGRIHEELLAYTSL